MALTTSAGQGSFAVTPDQGKVLLRLARRAIAERLGLADETEPGPVGAEWLQTPRGVFVTLRTRGRLRGCIGYPEPILPLGEAVRKAAVGAAFHDPRFPPLEPEEYPEVRIEINVLTPPVAVRTVEGIEVGRHGLIVRQGSRRGLLLPSVPVEYGWDRETFLAHTCLKAGLAPDAWKSSSTTIFVFESEIFQEEEDHD